MTLSAKGTGNNINYATSAAYAPDSSLTGFVSGNSPTFGGVTNRFLCTPRLQPCRMIADTSGTLPVLCGDTAHGNVLDLGYDFHLGNGTTGTDNGNVYGITNYKDQTRNQTFAYDLLNRLTSAQNSGTDCSVLVLQNKTKFWGNSYVYDAWGNLLQKIVTKCNAEHLVATADAQNRIHVSAPDFIYDAAGNMTTDVTDGVTAFYDQENRISTATGSGITTTYTYDSDGNRVRKSTGNLAANGTLYWYMAPGVVAESDLAGTTNSEYVFFDGERVARRDGASGTGGVFYYFSDHLKTASVITDSSGNIKSESDFYPWGGELPIINGDSNHYKFTGKERDIETGLDYFGARYYSNGLGRWVSADWSATPVPVPYAEFIDPQSLNLYGYVRSIPTTRFDQDGHADDDCGWWCRTKQRFHNSNVGLGFRTDAEVKTTAKNFRNNITNDETLQVYFGAKGELRSYTRDQLDKMSDAQIIALVDEIGPDAPSNEATQEMAVALGAASQYNDITKGNSVKNIQTDVKRADFESNLSANGWNKSTSKDGLTTIYEKDGAKYVIRDNAKSTGTPTADFYKAGSNEINIKIRMPQ